jgi:hypothetical protein
MLEFTTIVKPTRHSSPGKMGVSSRSKERKRHRTIRFGGEFEYRNTFDGKMDHDDRNAQSST